MGSLSIWHWLIVLLVIVLIFGTKKLRNLGSDLGGAMRGFKEGLQGGDGNSGNNAQSAPTANANRTTIEGEAHKE